MTELNQLTGAILTQAQELLKLPGVKETVTGFLGWMGKKIFSKSKAAQERLILIEQQQADAQTIATLMGNLETLLEDNEELQQELNEKVTAVQTELKQAGVNITKTNTGTVTGNDVQFFQDVTGNITTTKIGRQINQGNNSNYNENKG
jgi:hypothetical protein